MGHFGFSLRAIVARGRDSVEIPLMTSSHSSAQLFEIPGSERLERREEWSEKRKDIDRERYLFLSV